MVCCLNGTVQMIESSGTGGYLLICLLTLVEFWGLPPLIPLLQCVNRLGFEICSVNSCQSEQGSLVMLI